MKCCLRNNLVGANTVSLMNRKYFQSYVHGKMRKLTENMFYIFENMSKIIIIMMDHVVPF